jgi:(4-(4-[2-(gamma-L-glutamylamino)ethyl]phenoxymethyl)furan-2-yl)methanamine synthase
MNAFTPTEKAKQSPWLGIDIGGANIKAAHVQGWSSSRFFPMWKEWKSLAHHLAQLLQESPAFVGVGVTMTGELADCFASRADGVAIILEQVTSILPASMVRVYDCAGNWKTVSNAARDPWSVAASNWHALARYVGSRLEEKSFLLFDVGSTTTDIIPIIDHVIAMDAQTDSQRLQAGSLVYTGVERSNVAGIVRELPLFGNPCPVMNELFATTLDVNLWLGNILEDSSRTDTADNKPATREHARYRLARTVGEDGTTLADCDVDAVANAIFRAQCDVISHRVQQVSLALSSRRNARKKPLTSVQHVVYSGHGDFLIDAVIARLGWKVKRTRLQSILGESLSRCLPAYAVASLASDEL